MDRYVNPVQNIHKKRKSIIIDLEFENAREAFVYLKDGDVTRIGKIVVRSRAEEMAANTASDW